MTTEEINQTLETWFREHQVTFKITLIGSQPFFPEDTLKRDVYSLTLTRNNKTVDFRFGQSIYDSYSQAQAEFVSELQSRFGRLFAPKDPQEWLNQDRQAAELFCKRFNLPSPTISTRKAPQVAEIVYCLQKYPYFDFSDFCAELGYDPDSRKAYTTFEACNAEYGKLRKLFSAAEIEEIDEITREL